MSVSEPALQSFLLKKRKILSDLSVPSTEYKDRSPKGSVDEGIRDLIDEINAIEGLVTTSSCAGRVSVFLEGEKTAATTSDQDDESPIDGPAIENDHPTNHEPSNLRAPGDKRSKPKGVAGGKGHGGRWLFVSHDPIPLPLSTSSPSSNTPLHDLFGLTPQPPPHHPTPPLPRHARLIRLQFEPLLLHILCATLSHAHAPLSAAISSGFRESGLQSLSCLSHPSTHHPILGIRSSGLTFSTVIGYLDTANTTVVTNPPPTTPRPETNNEVLRSLVTESYLTSMLHEISQRFVENRIRRDRFLTSLKTLTPSSTATTTTTSSLQRGREDPVQRARRKREEGLRRRDEAARQHDGDGESETTDILLDDGLGLE